MATVYSSRTCLPKFCCLIVAIGLFTAIILITGAYPHQDLHNHHNQTVSSTNTTNLNSTGNYTLAAETLAFIQASNKELHAHLDKALARIHQNIQKSKELGQRISRSPRAIKAIQALESQCSTKTSQNQNTRLQNTPLVKDAGNANQVSTHSKSQISLNTKCVTNTAKTRSWGRKSRKFSIKTPIYRTKLQKNTRRHQRSSKRTQLWPWSRGRSPPNAH
jgi:hypothetical protein